MAPSASLPPFSSSSSPIAVIRPAFSLVVPLVEIAAVEPYIINFTGSGFVPLDSAGLSSISLEWRAEADRVNRSCQVVAAGPLFVSCRMPSDIVAGRLEAYATVSTNVSLNITDPALPNVSLSSDWTSALDLQPRIRTALSLVYLDEVSAEILNFTVNGAGFSPTASENTVLFSLGSSAGSLCTITRATSRSITCSLPRSALVVGDLFASVRVRGVLSPPSQIATIAAAFSLVPRTSNVAQPLSGGAIAATVVVVLVVVGLALTLFVFRAAVKARIDAFRKKNQAPETYATHVDKIPMAEVIAALTPADEDSPAEDSTAPSAADSETAAEEENSEKSSTENSESAGPDSARSS